MLQELKKQWLKYRYRGRLTPDQEEHAQEMHEKVKREAEEAFQKQAKLYYDWDRAAYWGLIFKGMEQENLHKGFMDFITKI